MARSRDAVGLREAMLLLWREIRIVLPGCALLALVGCAPAEDSLQSVVSERLAEPVVLKVNVMEAVLSEGVFETASSYGTLKPKRSSFLSFAKAGRVAEVLKEVGDKVQADEELASLEQAEIENSLEELQESLDSLNQRLSRLNPNSNLTSTRNQRNRLSEQIASQEAQQRELQRELEKGVIAAPYPCILAERNIAVGVDYPAGRPALKIVEDAPPIIELNVAADLAQRLSLDQKAWLSYGEQLIAAKIAYKSPELSQATLTRKLILEVGDDDPDRSWVYGDSVEARFWFASEDSGYWLPYSALQREQSGLWSAFVVVSQKDSQVIERRTIEILLLTDDHALVAGSLQAGELVVLDGSNRITPGQNVTPSIVSASFSQTGPPGTGE